MRKLSFWLIGLPLAALVAVFAVNNRAVAEVSLWPTPFTVDLPVYLLVLGALAVGLIAGAFMMWTNAVALRVRLHNRDLEIRSLKRDLDRTTTSSLKKLEKAGAKAALPPAA
ncbi:lipopolysaccharide assembly protein LapA domain-containing protein [Pararhodospirillum photometricum]|uniref:Lipopolysaccharide assembly protein A domain-containing protein n=1 Tax=Pararhodospirillum photometricum DSM 122 TaxID=1150469 RepID=H6SLF0_PARPM|nr:LapA family protein [Pararhodospirillum photometricum]CCG08815.1 Putative uncharacterized protein [Pararhodospirillum photometricum DSM 122]